MIRKLAIPVLVITLWGLTSMSWAAGGGGQALPEPAGLLSLTPVHERSCIAVQVPVATTQAVSGVRWFNNDGSVAFPLVLVATGQGELPPQYELAVEVGQGVYGPSEDWGEVSFAQPIASTTNRLYVVFQLPPYAEKVGQGAGGGPAIGYRPADGSCVFFSGDGDDWVRLDTDYALLVEPIYVTREPGMLALSAPQTPGTVENQETPLRTALLPAYPNPFNPLTHIPFTLREPVQVRLALYDIRGQLVRDLLAGFVAAGPNVVDWNGRDSYGRLVASGMYIARLQVGPKALTRNLVLVR
jgi:hypothetical protein